MDSDDKRTVFDKSDNRKMSGSFPREMFELSKAGERLTDAKFDTKPIGYFKDAWMRFKKNKASVSAAVIIIFLFAWAIFAPLFSPFSVADVDGIYANARPKLAMFARSGFWDGGANRTFNDEGYIYINSIGIGATSREGVHAAWEEASESPFHPVIRSGEPFFGAADRYFREVRVDTYKTPGFVFITLRDWEHFDEIRAWEEENGLQIIFPMIDTHSPYMSSFNIADANFWYRHNHRNEPIDRYGRVLSLEQVMEHGLTDNYLRDWVTGEIMYHRILDMVNINVRVLYYNYYYYLNGRAPMFIFGADAVGFDLMVRMASGTLVSLAIAVAVSIINLTIGAYLGAIQGYYGGWLDLILQRITEIIANFPFIILYSLIAVHLVNTGRITAFWGLVLAFVIAGWIGTSRLVRMQFYRFKNQEYILAARTLGAKNNRLMFKHIFPNAIGTIITSSVLVIPGVIFSESVLSYLGIVNFDTAAGTSLGTMLANARGALATDPHVLFFPSVVISLLMISFNLFGNGLRDAFNPSLRGSDE